MAIIKFFTPLLVFNYYCHFPFKASHQQLAIKLFDTKRKIYIMLISVNVVQVSDATTVDSSNLLDKK